MLGGEGPARAVVLDTQRALGSGALCVKRGEWPHRARLGGAYTERRCHRSVTRRRLGDTQVLLFAPRPVKLRVARVYGAVATFTHTLFPSGPGRHSVRNRGRCRLPSEGPLMFGDRAAARQPQRCSSGHWRGEQGPVDVKGVQVDRGWVQGDGGQEERQEKSARTRRLPKWDHG